MAHPVSCLRAVSWSILLGVAGMAMADANTETEPERSEVVQGRPIDCGFLILNGRYAPPPYVVRQRGDDLLINEHVIAAERLAGLGGPGMGAGGGPRVRRPWWEEGLPTLVAPVERRLKNDAMLIVTDGASAGFVPRDQVITVLDILLCEESTQTKVEWLVDEGLRWIPTAQWAAIVETFEPTPELMERVGTEVAEHRRIREENEASHRRLTSPSIFRSGAVRYGVTVATLGLAVLALGNLLSYRPNGQARWGEVDSAGEGVPMVIRNVVLLVLLGMLDLVFTLGAQQGGGFLELNPLGSRLATSPVLLTSFKMAGLVGACLILLTLRRYRGAQVASWWLCLLCTVLTFRWLTYNSMFLG